jgi:hypothetical protein
LLPPVRELSRESQNESRHVSGLEDQLAAANRESAKSGTVNPRCHAELRSSANAAVGFAFDCHRPRLPDRRSICEER